LPWYWPAQPPPGATIWVVQFVPKSTPAPDPLTKCDARIRLIGPVRGIALSSVVPAASVRKSTSAWKSEMSPVASCLPCSASRHQVAPSAVFGTSLTRGSGSSVRKATLKNAGGAAATPAPPG